MAETDQDSKQLVQESLDILKLIETIRSEADLRPLFKAKRKLKEVEPTEEETEDNKRLKFEQLQAAEEEALTAKRRSFMKRLESFSTLFHCVPRPFSALDCAKHGWRDTHNVIEKHTRICVLSCDDCNNNMYVIELDTKHAQKPDVFELEKKCRAGLLTCHSESCQWRTNSCDTSIYNFPITSIAEGLGRFKNEAGLILMACRNKHQSIPQLEHSLDDKTLLKVHTLAQEFEKEQLQDDLSEETKDSAYILSLFGWKLLHMDVVGICCDLCFSRRAFYQMKPDEKIDVLQLHKDYCPWRNAATADAYSPRLLPASRHKRISGIDWMIQVISIEYIMLAKKHDLSLESRQIASEKLYQLKQKLYESEDLLQTWKEQISKNPQASE